ncbi:MAG TPA: PAS domain S-box protein [Melioribacteraceae bacterium]|nr:PAS domain S-box protein [Melioribacteraceae bacterium]
MVNKTLLLVEDDESHVELIKRSFESGENIYEIFNARNLAEAKSLLIQVNPDIILCDWRLPDGDGIDLLKFTNGTETPPFVMMTSYGNEKFAVEAIKLGALDYVVKSSETLNNMEYILNKSLREWELIKINNNMQAELKKNEELLAKIFNNAVDIIFIKNTNKEFISVNNSFLQLFGLKLEEVIGEKLELLNINLNLPIVEETDNRVLQGETVNHTIEIIVKNNKMMLNEIKSPLFDENEKIIGIFGIARDVTEKELQKTELRKLSKAVEQSPSGIIITDEKGFVQYANSRFLQITKYEEVDIIGKPLKQPEQFDINLKNWLSIKPGEMVSGEIFDIKKNGECFWGYVAIAPITDQNSKIAGFVCVLEDTTEKKEFEKQLIEAKEEAVKADRLKSEFLAQMSHEIRTPINAILSFSGLLREELKDKIDDDFKSVFEFMELSGKRIIRTIDLLLNMSELQTGSFKVKPKKFDIQKRVLDYIYHENINEANKKNIKFEILNRLTENEVFCDEYSTQQILSVLAENAIKFTEKGEVQIVVFKNQQHNVVFEVRDTGIGISEEYMSNLFTPFSQEEQGYSRRFEGNGLGLAIAKRYCDLNNAKIKAKSKKGFGTTFTVELPHN